MKLREEQLRQQQMRDDLSQGMVTPQRPPQYAPPPSDDHLDRHNRLREQQLRQQQMREEQSRRERDPYWREGRLPSPPSVPMSVWRDGMWLRGAYYGLDGWWWAVGNLLFYYDEPFFPYPGQASPYVYQAPPAGYSPQVMPYLSRMVYYCDRPAGYYPYVTACSVPFRLVPAR